MKVDRRPRWLLFHCGQDFYIGPGWYILQIVLFPNWNVPYGDLVAGWHFEAKFRVPRLLLRAFRVKPLPAPPADEQGKG